MKYILVFFAVIFSACIREDKPFVVISETLLYQKNKMENLKLFYADHNIIFINKDTVYYHKENRTTYNTWCGLKEGESAPPFIEMNQSKLIRIGIDTLEKFFEKELNDSVAYDSDSEKEVRRPVTVLLKSDMDSIYNRAYPILKKLIIKKGIKQWYDTFITEEEYQVIQANRLNLNYETIWIQWGKTRYLAPRKIKFIPPIIK